MYSDAYQNLKKLGENWRNEIQKKKDQNQNNPYSKQRQKLKSE